MNETVCGTLGVTLVSK